MKKFSILLLATSVLSGCASIIEGQYNIHWLEKLMKSRKPNSD